MNIPVHLLQSLVAFADHLSVAKAAHASGTTQPTITRHLQQLQVLIKSPLFESHGKRKILTPFAVQLAVQLRERLDSLHEIVRRTETEFGDPRNVTLRVAARAEILRRLFSEVAFPCSVRLEPMTGGEIRRAIESAAVDIAVGRQVPLTSAFVQKRLFEDGYSCIVPKKFLADSDSLGSWISQCRKFPLAGYHPVVPHVAEALTKLTGGASMNVQVTVGDWQVVERRVHAGLAWSVIPDSFIPSQYPYERFDFPLAGRSQFFVYYRKNLRRHDWFRTLIDSIGGEIPRPSTGKGARSSKL